MSILNHFASLTTYPKIFLLEVFCILFCVVVVLIYFRFGDKAKTQRDEPWLDALADDGDIRSMLHRYPAPITGKALFLQMNEEYFDAIFSAFMRALLQAGYTLSDREMAPTPLLSASILHSLAREVDRARQEYMRGLGEDIEDDIRYHMQSGRAQTFLMQLIGSCERLGWKVIPVIREPEEACANSFSALP